MRLSCMQLDWCILGTVYVLTTAGVTQAILISSVSSGPGVNPMSLWPGVNQEGLLNFLSTRSLSFTIQNKTKINVYSKEKIAPHFLLFVFTGSSCCWGGGNEEVGRCSMYMLCIVYAIALTNDSLVWFVSLPFC